MNLHPPVPSLGQTRSASTADWQPILEKFQQVWGYSTFRPPQDGIVRSLLNGQDTLVVMPTGGGKSICFQLPALLNQGLTLVISPLVALMEDQVQDLQRRKLPAALLHNEVSKRQRQQTLNAIRNHQLRLLYLSPETLLSPSVWECLCLPNVQINGLILDEAHCLVQWGDTFRPAYRRLGAVRPALLRHKPPGTRMAIAAFTATANPTAQQTIKTVLGLRQPQQFLLNPYRENLRLSVKIAWTPSGRRRQLRQWINRYPNQAGLVYVRTRRDSETLAQELQKQGYRTMAYHAGLCASDRRQIEADWLNDRLQFVVCTCAFGMGINKPDVRWICHFHPPTLLSEYVQEVGRAGRDGKSAYALMLVSEPTGWLDPDDKQRHQFFMQHGRSHQQKAIQLFKQLPPRSDLHTLHQRFPDSDLALALIHQAGRLRWIDPFRYELIDPGKPLQIASNADTAFQDYVQTRSCRWQFLLNAFGFTQDAQGFRCGTCDRCSRHYSASHIG
ncbi:MAG: ATP-dependent DNA helicase RecQ [Synechococcales cyanobacterium T60_A2020_003]|nr:ATP-dependent DNA helicase RecQ [Synechococcales cyanobacterium T60_A2020_003]